MCQEINNKMKKIMKKYDYGKLIDIKRPSVDNRIFKVD